MAKRKNDPAEVLTTPEESHQGEMSEAEIDRNLEDTFPASDPPSWTLGINHRKPSADEANDKSEMPE